MESCDRCSNERADDEVDRGRVVTDDVGLLEGGGPGRAGAGERFEAELVGVGVLVVVRGEMHALLSSGGGVG